MLKNNLAEMPENYDMADDVKASTFMTETEVQATVASNVNDNREGDFPPPPKGGAATKAVEENTVNKDDPDISRPLSIEDIIKNKQLSPETLTEIINAAQNDNLFPTKKLNGKELTDKINELREWVDTEENRLKSIPFSIELYSQKKAVLQVRAAYVLVLECLIGEALRQIPRLNGTNSKSEGRASGQERTKSQIIKEDYGLSPRLARDFQHLTWDGVKAALELALRQNDVPTRALALSKSASIRAKQNKNNKKIKHTKFILDYMEETETKTLELEKPMYITTLFSNISIGLSRIHELNLHCRVAAEWDKTRAHWHELLYPDCHMVQLPMSVLMKHWNGIKNKAVKSSWLAVVVSLFLILTIHQIKVMYLRPSNFIMPQILFSKQSLNILCLRMFRDLLMPNLRLPMTCLKIKTVKSVVSDNICAMF